MHMRLFAAALLISGILAGHAFAQSAPAMLETPMYVDQVKAGTLPSVDKRIPAQPSIVKQFSGPDGVGRPGGQVNMLVASARDTRLMTIYSNARLIVYDDQFKLQPDILESYEV